MTAPRPGREEPTTAEPDPDRLTSLVLGFIPAQIMRTMATLDLADRLAGGPASPEELAKLTGCHAPSLRRLLRGAAFVGLLALNDDGAYELTPDGHLLRADVPRSVKQLAVYLTGEPTWSACGSIEHTVRTGQPAVDHVFGQSGYAWLAKDPAAQAEFYESCAGVARQDVPALVEALDLSAARDIVDAGGGNGLLMTGLLVANPALAGVVFDQPASLASARATLRDAGVADRCELAAGDFLADPLPPDRDVYVLKSVLCDWGDDDAVRILRACSRAMRADSVLLVIDLVLPEGNARPDPVALMSDLCTLACGGAVRTEREFADLAAAAGLRLTESSETGAATSILRAIKA
ncbi:methyltransferase [Amycolatopsis sp. VS8301801F10]|uniref:methyltransferase n=1 Tax=Amycolatopsis sp. VS8301801F10 TaxID=2652442 RepID=UPI0038FCB454